MGWWPFSGGSQSDAVDKLDPKLRAFLEKESPLKYTPAQSQQTQPPPESKPTPVATSTDSKTEPDNEARPLPKESLFQDGRYAHLWKNYKPLAEIEEETATDHEKLMNVLESYKARKSRLSKVAMENCAEWHEEWVNCMKHGDYKDQMQMCRHQVRRYESCFKTQSRFLRALGYGSVEGRSPEIEEDIQMHADALYQRVVEHEKAVKAATEAGTPIPKFDPIIPRVGATTATTTTNPTTSTAPEVKPSEELQEKWRERLEKLPEEERALEEAALHADLQRKTEVARGMREILEKKKPEGEEAGLGSAILSMLRGGK